jgi:hypothetical protein
MSDDMRMNRPMPPRPESMTHMGDHGRRGGSSRAPWLVLVVVLVIVAGLAVIFRDRLFTDSGNGTAAAKLSGYQAVFLTNGQVYFGKLSNASDTYVTLKDIFYLQVSQQPPLQGQGSQQQNQQQPQLSLVKLGNELHGPDDEMQINRDQILFYEDIKDSGKVAEAIKSYKANPPATSNQTPANQQQTTPTTPEQ